MLDPRIYRMSLIVPALALVVLAFSLTAQPGALHSSLAPAAFDGANVARTVKDLAAADPRRAPGSPADDQVAGTVARTLRSRTDGFSVVSDTFTAHTVDGVRRLRNVIATRPGTASSGGAIVVVAPRDEPGEVGLSGTAMLLELGRVLGGETLDRTIVLASTSGSTAALGARRLAAHLPGPVDAVLVLGDVASVRRRQPIIVPWSSGEAIAPVRLRATLAAALARQASVHAGSPDLADQLAHLAFPLTLSAQGPFAARGIPAVELSLSGERGPRAGDPVVSTAQLGGIGRGVLSAVSALDNGPSVAPPSAYVLFDGEVVPSWAISLFVLALILPVALTMIDGLARARRRRHPVGRSLLAVAAAAAPFLVAGLVIVIGGALGALDAPPGAVAPGVIPVDGAALAVIIVALLAALGAGVLTHAAFRSVVRAEAARPLRPSRAAARVPADRPTDDGIAAAMLLILCVAAVLLWLADPFAAALLVPALHLWLWAVDSDLSAPLPVRLVMLALGVVPTAGLVLFYAHSLGFSAGELAWAAALLLAGHVVSWVGLVEWSVVLGCGLTAVVLVVAAARRPVPAAPPVTVRGPVGYAGPGSLGGTKSALRR
jgi:hypothetical protein